MKQEDKKLLLKDLCARLPYRVKCIIDGLDDCTLMPSDIEEERDVKPYLRPMSSITRGEKEEFEQIRYNAEAKLFNAFLKGGFTLAFHEINDWLNAHHFDYHGLIGKDLAIAVDKNNNPYDR